MTDFEKKALEMDLRMFTSKNFERPSVCSNLEQVRFYIGELCNRIETYKTKSDYIPEYAYTLLAQYNARQNALLYREFVNTY